MCFHRMNAVDPDTFLLLGVTRDSGLLTDSMERRNDNCKNKYNTRTPRRRDNHCSSKVTLGLKTDICSNEEYIAEDC